jgi:hypothetical protein
MSDDSVKNEKASRGRPRKVIDAEQVRRLAELQCTAKEIAYVLGVSSDTIRRNHQTDLEIGNAQGKIKLRRAMFRNATEKDNPTIQIWLSKQYLDMSDQPNNSDDSRILPWESESDTDSGE